jgi:hypothetical protein
VNQMSERYLEDFAVGQTSAPAGYPSKNDGSSRSPPSSIPSPFIWMTRLRASRFRRADRQRLVHGRGVDAAVDGDRTPASWRLHRRGRRWISPQDLTSCQTPMLLRERS